MNEAEGLLGLYEAKALAELCDADGLAGVAPGGWRGPVLAAVVLIVGSPGASADTLLPGEAGDAAAKAMAGLGYDADSVFVIASRPPGSADAAILAKRLRLAIEAVDPLLVLALDGAAAQDLAAAYGLSEIPVGAPAFATGRIVGYAGEFCSSLGDVAAKAPVWRAMKAIAAADAPGNAARRLSAPRGKSAMSSDGPRV